MASNDVYGMLKPREIREKLRGKIDPAVGTVLVQLCEDSRETRRVVVELAKTLDQFTNIINSMMHISDALKNAYERQFGTLKPPKTELETVDSKVKQITGGDTQ